VAQLTQLQRSHGNQYVQRALRAALAKSRCACGGTCSACEPKHGAEREEPPRLGRSPGRQLEAQTRAFFEARFGRDFGDVRVHDDVLAAESAAALGAHAYTLGTHIAFASGRFSPQTRAGRRLLAHELTHVVQQGNPTPRPAADLKIAPTGDASEREARMVADALTEDRSSSSPGADGLRPAPRAPLPVAHSVGRHVVALQTNEDTEDADAQVSLGALDNPLVSSAAEAVVGGPAHWQVLREFLRGLWAGLQSLPPEQKQRIDEKLKDFGAVEAVEYAGGYALGIVEGLWASIEGLFDAVITLIKLPYEIGGFLAEKLPELASRYGPRIAQLLSEAGGISERLKGVIEGFVRNPAKSISQISSFLDALRGLALTKVRAFGHSVAGKALALLEEPWFEYGRDIGKVVGQILFEVILAVASDAIANIVKEALSIAGRIAARLVAGAVELIRSAGRLLGVAVEWIARLGRRAAGELGELFESVRVLLDKLRTTIAELGEEALAETGAGGVRVPVPEVKPTVLESRAVKPPARTPKRALGEEAKGATKRREPYAEDPEFHESVWEKKEQENAPGAKEDVLKSTRRLASPLKSRTAQSAGLFNIDKHHVFPQEMRRNWFEPRGMTGANDIDNFTINLEKAVHQAEHGGGNWRLARSEQWFNEYNTAVRRELEAAEAEKAARLGDPSAELDPTEIKETVFKILDQRGLPHRPEDFVQYK
jgi:hypothetical protein